MTKVEKYAYIREVFLNATSEDADAVKEILDFCDSETEKLGKAAVRAKEKAAEKAAAGDALRAAVADILTEDPQTINEITAQLDIEDITPAKVTNRLGQLVKNGLAVRSEVKTEDGRTIKAFSKVPAEVAD